MPEYLTRRQLAEHLGVSSRTVERWEKDGCPVEKWGKRLVRYRLVRVEPWLRTRGG